MLRMFQKPLVELKQKNPNWICGRELTWLNIYIVGSCWVLISSESHPGWKPIKIKSSLQEYASIAVPIGATLTIRARSLMRSNTSYFEVAKADWSINPPSTPKVILGQIEPTKKLSNTWLAFVRGLEKTRPIRSKTSIRKIILKPRFINMRISKKISSS
jgi:hypothetical protein